MANPTSEHVHPNGPKPMLSFIPAGVPRKIAEVLVAAVPGALLQFVFIVSAAGLNIWSTGSNPNEGTYALVYLPVVCLLPAVVGAISTLMYERVQGAQSAHVKGSMLTAAWAALIGTLLGAVVIIISSMAVKGAKPMGAWMTDPVMIIGLSLAMVVVSTVLAAVGAAIVSGVLNKMEK